MTKVEREVLVAAVSGRMVSETMRMFLADDLDAVIDCAGVFGESGLTEAEIASVTVESLNRANATLTDLDARGLDVLGLRTPSRWLT